MREDDLPAPAIAESVLDLIGNTPLVKLGRLARSHRLRPTLAAKMETTNPGGSSKDRPALEMVLAAERDGLLHPGGTIVEPTSGNTGVGLAIVAAQRGYRCHFVTTDKVAPEKVDLLRAYGADVTVCPVAVPPEHPASYYSTAERLVREIPHAFRPNQYANPANPLSHEKTTGPEIWRQSGGRVTHFVAGVGTCGTITGVARYLKRMNPDIQVIAADPEGSVFSGGSGRPYLTEGVGEDFFPDAWDPSVLDRVIACSDEEAYLMARQVAREEGVLLGSSGGLAVAAAIKAGRDLTDDDLIVVLIPDSGRGYLSRVYNDEWMATYGFLRECDLCVGAVLDARSEEQPALLYVNPEQTVREAVSLMRRTGVSQLPVCKNEPPFATAEVSGAVDELALMDAVFRDPSVLDTPVEKVMGPKLPTVGVGQPLSRVVEMLDKAPALLVLAGGRPLSVMTRTDVLTFLSPSAPIRPDVADQDEREGLGFETRAIHTGQPADAASGSVVTPITLSTTFAQRAVGEHQGFEYSRSGNPTRAALEACLASLEGAAHGFAFASGLASEDNVLRLLRPGDRILLGNDAYGGTFRLISKVYGAVGYPWSSADLTDLDVLRDGWLPDTRMVWLETPTNPLLTCIDIEAVATVAHEKGALVVVDNTFATPYLQQPLGLGADIVVHSVTKYLGGHSDVVGGFAALDDDELAERLRFTQNAAGAVPAPFDCYLVLRGLKTLAVRMDRHCTNARAVVDLLVGHAAVDRVLYPQLPDHPGHAAAARQMRDFGGMVSFTLRGGEAAALEVVQHTELFTLAESLGAVESLIEHPGRMTHASAAGSPLEVPDSLVRLSVGLESADDLVADLEQALDRI